MNHLFILISLFYFRVLQEYTCWLLMQFPSPWGGEGRVFMDQANDFQAGPFRAGAWGAGKRRAGSLALPWLIPPALPQLERPKGTASSASSVTDGRLRALEHKGLAHVQRVLVSGFLRIKCLPLFLPCPHLACPHSSPSSGSLQCYFLALTHCLAAPWSGSSLFKTYHPMSILHWFFPQKRDELMSVGMCVGTSSFLATGGFLPAVWFLSIT